jgi:crotonobetainyl-CoA:carnitine CoA-transferase CaiB-like acyl-CoA transferase
MGSAHPSGAPYQAFQGSDGEWFVLSANAQRLWERFCRLIGRPELTADPRFVANADRVSHREALVAELTPILRKRPAAHWLGALESEGIPAAPVNRLDQAFAEPQARAREMVVELDHPVAGRHRVLGVPVKLSATPGAVRAAAPTYGQHTEEVLRTLGYGAEEIRALQGSGEAVPQEVRR